MKSFSEEYLNKLLLPVKMISTLTKIGEYKGKEELYKNQSPETLKKLLNIAIVESAECSNKIENIIVSHERVKSLVLKNTKPKNRDEQEVIGYRDVLNIIHESHESVPLTSNIIKQFHSMMYRYTNIPSGNWKTSENQIVDKLADGTIRIRFKTTSAFETPSTVENLLVKFVDLREEGSIDPLVLIPLFILDFLCIHPFRDGNGRISRLLTLLLLYNSRHQIGKYISLERIVENTKESYYEALKESSLNWHKGKHDASPWLNYFHGILISAYKEYESRVGIFTGKGSKTDQVKAACESFLGDFSVSDILSRCPNVGIDLIRKVLKDMKKDGIVNIQGKGRYARWKLKKTGNK